MPLVKGMRDLGLKDAKLDQLPGSDLRKVAIALVLQKKTSVRQRWVADRLKMGRAANVSQHLRRFAKIPTREKGAAPFILTCCFILLRSFLSQ